MRDRSEENKATPSEQFNLILRSLPSQHVPAVIRLRRFLKSALRAWGFQCVECSAGDAIKQPPPKTAEKDLLGDIPQRGNQ
jgi:hypothetical protein